MICVADALNHFEEQNLKDKKEWKTLFFYVQMDLKMESCTTMHVIYWSVEQKNIFFTYLIKNVNKFPIILCVSHSLYWNRAIFFIFGINRTNYYILKPSHIRSKCKGKKPKRESASYHK